MTGKEPPVPEASIRQLSCRRRALPAESALPTFCCRRGHRPVEWTHLHGNRTGIFNSSCGRKANGWELT